jgi:hypothetical protein
MENNAFISDNILNKTFILDNTPNNIDELKTEDGNMKNRFEHQNVIHSDIRNDEDYDDWEYGTEPIIFR